jgi:hypothetical protein
MGVSASTTQRPRRCVDAFASAWRCDSAAALGDDVSQMPPRSHPFLGASGEKQDSYLFDSSRR